MRLSSYLSLLSALVLWVGCKPSGPAVEVQWRFVGGAALRQQTNAPVLREALSLKESAEVHGLLVTNVAQRLWTWTTGESNAPASVIPHAVVLADQLLDRMTLGQVFRPNGNRRDWAVAFPAQGTGEELKTAWTKFFAAANPSAVPDVATSGSWLVAVSDSKLLKPAEVLKTLAKIPAEAGDALRCEWNPAAGPGVSLVAQLKDGVVRMNAKLGFTGSFPAKLPNWQVPRLVRDPLVQFAALRWVEPLLERSSALRLAVGAEKPEQLFLWSYPATPTYPELRTYGAIVGVDAAKRFQQVTEGLKPHFDLAESNSAYEGNILVEPSLPRISLNGLPVVTPPSMLVITNDTNPYLLVGAARPVFSTNRPPAELLKELERPALVYYHWEITGEALRNWVAIDQLTDMISRKRPSIRTSVLRWTQALGARTEVNSVTEASITGDRQITVVRKSPLGLTGLELTELAQWLGENAPRDRMPRTAPRGR